MRRLLFLLFFPAVVITACSQPPADRPALLDSAFDQKLSGLLSFTTPLIGIDEFLKIRSSSLVLDTRRRAEFEVSHIPGARFLGFEEAELSQLRNLPRDTTIVLYCSVGYRSEKIGDRLRQEGFYRVFNLYGSIFEWVNRGRPLVDSTGRATRRLHTYNREWSRWVDGGKVEKIW